MTAIGIIALVVFSILFVLVLMFVSFLFGMFWSEDHLAMRNRRTITAECIPVTAYAIHDPGFPIPTMYDAQDGETMEFTNEKEKFERDFANAGHAVIRFKKSSWAQ